MARHMRKVFRPGYITQQSNLIGTPPERVQTSINANDADAAGGKLLRNMKMVTVLGQVDTADALINSDTSTGLVGMFKWPIDAAAPTVSTLDYENRASVFAREPFAVIGDHRTVVTLRVKTVTLRPGDELFFFVYRKTESSSTVDVYSMSILQYWLHDTIS